MRSSSSKWSGARASKQQSKKQEARTQMTRSSSSRSRSEKQERLPLWRLKRRKQVAASNRAKSKKQERKWAEEQASKQQRKKLEARTQMTRSSSSKQPGARASKQQQQQMARSKKQEARKAPALEVEKEKTRCKSKHAIEQEAEGKPNKGLKLVFSQVRKPRVALWAACSGPVPSFRARVFRHSDTCTRAGGKPGFEASFYGPLTAAVQQERQGLKLKLISNF